MRQAGGRAGVGMPARDDGEVRLRSSGSRQKATAVAAVATYGAYVLLGMNTPLPGRDQDISGDLEVERHEFVTADGLTLRLKRYANPGGSPVILTHGFGGNGFTFDLPREGRNMAVHLAREGFDVWIPHFRGCGRDPYVSDAGDWRHSMDHLAIYDAPAAVKRYGYESVSSEMREYVQLPGYGHVDMLIGRGVETDVFPLVADWIKEVEAHS